MLKVGLVVRDDRKEICELSSKVIDWVNSNRYDLFVEELSAADLKITDKKIVTAKEIVDLAELIVCLGGDGTLIGIAREAKKKSPIMLGVNFGTLGFLTEFLPEELIDILELYNKGDCRISERMMLTAKVFRKGKEVFFENAVNDAVVQHIAPDGLVKLDMFYGTEEITRLQADGVIVATPTGSTAYSLAAGGSVVHPNLNCALLTPICPHSLTNRPLILPLDPEIVIKIPKNRAKLNFVIDGQVDFRLEHGDEIRISKAANNVNFVRSPDRGYFKILQGKLNWGIPNRV